MRYFVTFLIIIGLIILGIILLIRAIFGGGEPAPQPKDELISYARTNKVMRLTIDGPVNYQAEHRRIIISVGSNENEIRVMQGYQSDVIRRQSFANNPEAYASFLKAIDRLGYTRGNDDEALADERGYCPQGSRYIFEIVDGNASEQRFWSTTCDGPATFEGRGETIIDLFQAQIPGYSQLTTDLPIR